MPFDSSDGPGDDAAQSSASEVMSMINSAVLLLALAAAGVLCSTEIETPILRFVVDAECLDLRLLGDHDRKPSDKIVVSDSGAPVAFIMSGKRSVTIESGMSANLNFWKGEDALSHVTAIYPEFKDFALDSCEFSSSMTPDLKDEVFDETVKARRKVPGQQDELLAVRYVKTGGRYLFLFSVGFMNGEQRSANRVVRWQGYPDRDPQLRDLFTHPISWP
jgi:hypothetical protein